MAVRPTQTSPEQRLSNQLRRDKASLETKKGSRGTALRISTDPKETPARRAEFKAKYDKLVDEVNDLEDKIDSVQKQIAKDKTAKSKESAKDQLDSIKEEYNLIADAYAQNQEPSLKERMDGLADDYKDVYASVLGTPISRTAAYAILSGSGRAAGVRAQEGPTGTPAQTPRPTPTPTPETRPTITGGATGGRTGGATGGTAGRTPSPTGEAIPSNFDVGSFRMADEASMAAAGGTALKTYDQALANVQEKYNLPDILFSQVKSLGTLLDRYVNAKKYGKDGIADIGKFVELVKIDPWYRANEGVIKQRYIEKYNYEDLLKSGKAVGNTKYEQDIRRITDKLVKQSRELGSAIDETQAKLIAEDLYIHNQDEEETTVTRRLVNFIRPIAGMIAGKITEDFSGLALKNYQGLQAIAKANGMKIENILPPGVDGKPATAEDTLKRIALGEIDPLRLEQDVRKLAAVGQPQFVRDLLGQGINLDTIYSPYKRTMARILELDEGQIDLMDPTLRMGINDKGDVNLYDYSKALRQDNRWQYTGNAREEVSDAALTVLRNFGFQG